MYNIYPPIKYFYLSGKLNVIKWGLFLRDYGMYEHDTKAHTHTHNFSSQLPLTVINGIILSTPDKNK